MVNYIALLVALILSGVAAYYSIIGLTTIFASAFIPIVIMGSSLEAAKVVAVSWVYRNWHTSPAFIKYYLISAICVLMLITSMGTFGYLSKAHMDQAVPTGAVQDKLNIIDEKITVQKEIIDGNRKALKQLDEAVDQVMGRTNDEKGADKANAIRRSQQKERSRIYAEIETSQKSLAALNQERLPLSAELRKVVAEVGPIKYIAELIYGEATDDIIDRAVRWVIILIVSVFDPLAIVLLIAANHGLYARKDSDINFFEPDNNPYECKDSWLTKAAALIKRKKEGILEIDKDSIAQMK